MTFFYDLNKRLAQLATKQDAQHLAEHATPAAQQPKKGSLAQALNERNMGKMRAKGQVEEMFANNDDESRDAINAANPPKTPSPVSSRAPGRIGGPEIPVKHHTYDRKSVASNISGKDSAAYDYRDYDYREQAEQGQLNELSPELLKKARDKAGEKWSAADDRKDKKASAKHNAQDDKFNSAWRKKQKGMTEAGMYEGASGYSPAMQAKIKTATPQQLGQMAYDLAGESGPRYDYELDMLEKAKAELSGMEEGNALGKAVVDAKRDGIQKGEKIRVGDKELPLKELDMRLLKGMQGSMKGSNTDSESERNRHKKYGYRSDRDDTGNDDDYDEYGNLKNKKKAAVSDGPKKKGRPTKEKQPERVTAKSYKYKSGRPTKTKEGLDSDGVMMTRPSNMSSEGVSPAEQGEYNDEAGMTKDSLHTIVRHAKELENALRSNENMPEWVQEKVGQIKGMMTSVTDYILSTHERDAEQHMGRQGIAIVPESADFSGSEVQQAYRQAVMLKQFIKDPDGIKVAADLIKLLRYKLQQSNDTLGGVDQLKEKSVSQSQARMMAGAAHNPKFAKKVGVATKVAKEFNKADKGKDIGKLPNKVKKTDEANDGNLANNAKPYDKVTQGDVVAGRLGKDEQGGKAKKTKEEKVDETTVAGSVATAAPSGKPSKGMQFGKGVYESLDRQFKQALTESISIESKMQECGDGEMAPAITIQADGEEAAKLMMLLKLAGLESQIPKACPTCGGSPCGCDQMVDENAPDWPTNTDTLAADPNLRTYSGGLNGPNSTGQTTIPVVASQLRRQASMEESIALERSLFKTWQNYKG